VSSNTTIRRPSIHKLIRRGKPLTRMGGSRPGERGSAPRRRYLRTDLSTGACRSEATPVPSGGRGTRDERGRHLLVVGTVEKCRCDRVPAAFSDTARDSRARATIVWSFIGLTTELRRFVATRLVDPSDSVVGYPLAASCSFASIPISRRRPRPTLDAGREANGHHVPGNFPWKIF
jgi:hypothetical protein